MNAVGNRGLLSRLRLPFLSLIRLPSHNQLAGLIWQARNHPGERRHISRIQQVARNISRKLGTGKAGELFLRVVSATEKGYVVRLEPPKPKSPSDLPLEHISFAYRRGHIFFAYYPKTGTHAALFAGALAHSDKKSPVELFPGSVVSTAVVPHEGVLVVPHIQGSFNPNVVGKSGGPYVPAWLKEVHRGAVSRLLDCVFDHALSGNFHTVRLVVEDVDGRRQRPSRDAQDKFKGSGRRKGYYPKTEKPVKIANAVYHWEFACRPQQPKRARRK